MDQNTPKEHFAALCECIWDRLLAEKGITDGEEAKYVREEVVLSAIMGWNICVTSETLAEARKKARATPAEILRHNEYSLPALLDAVELKWREYRDDKIPFAFAELREVDGKPRSCAYYFGETPDSPHLKNVLDLAMQPETIARLLKAATSPDKLEKEIDNLILDHCDVLLPELKEIADSKDEWLIPLSREELERSLEFVLWEQKTRQKRSDILNLFQLFPYLVTSCDKLDEDLKETAKQRTKKIEGSAYPGTIPELILAVWKAYSPTTPPPSAASSFLRDSIHRASDLVSQFFKKGPNFKSLEEPELIEFICDHVAAMGLPKGKQRQTMKVLVAWGLMISDTRHECAPYLGSEEYDFNPKEIMAMKLNVELVGHDCSAVVLVREDMTFDELQDYIVFMFDREPGHLYRFDCDDGCLAIHPEEETDEDDVKLANECYLGHHIDPDEGADFLYDYGDEWQFRITVLDFMKARGNNYPKTIEMTDEPPRDEDEDFEDED